MPFVTLALRRHLSLTTEAGTAVPRAEDGYHSLCALYALYRHACHPARLQRLTEGHLTMIGPLSDVRLRVMECKEIDAFGNPARLPAKVNTLAAYRALFRDTDALQGHQR